MVPDTRPAAAGPGLFPPDALVRQVNGETILLLGGGRALLMQLAHPLVARGVAEHSDFRSDPFSRLQRTLEAVSTIVFGSEAEARATAAAVRAVHDRVTGPGYQANDPDLLMWVHATLVDTALRMHARFIGSLTADEAEAYYQESKLIAELLGVPADRQPADLAAFRLYVRAMVGSLAGGVSDEAKALARSVLHPRLPWVVGPLAAVGRELTVGLLPHPLRQAYGFRWGTRRNAALLAASLSARQVLSRTPAPLRRLRVA
jgi:uncharacterized protein (DUF2236 family)